MTKTLEQRRAELALKGALSDCRLQLRAAAVKRGYLCNNFSIGGCEEDRAVYVSSNLNNVEKGVEQCEGVMKDCGYIWEIVRLKHAYLNVYYSAYKISF
jgi:hypothetical protein